MKIYAGIYYISNIPSNHSNAVIYYQFLLLLLFYREIIYRISWNNFIVNIAQQTLIPRIDRDR